MNEVKNTRAITNEIAAVIKPDEIASLPSFPPETSAMMIEMIPAATESSCGEGTTIAVALTAAGNEPPSLQEAAKEVV